MRQIAIVRCVSLGHPSRDNARSRPYPVVRSFVNVGSGHYRDISKEPHFKIGCRDRLYLDFSGLDQFQFLRFSQDVKRVSASPVIPNDFV